MIAVFVNPRSRANRKNPRLVVRLERALGDAGRLIAPESLEALQTEARTLAAAAPRVIAVHGGDGTLHRTLSALTTVWGDRPLPPIAVLGGGTMNVVSSSLHIRAPALWFLTRLAEMARAGAEPAVILRRCLRVGDRVGFVFGNGVLASFLVEYYARGGYGPARAVWLLARLVMSGTVGGPFAARVARRFKGRVTIDGEPMKAQDFTALAAGTVREIGFGFKLIDRADDDPDRFGVVAIHSGVLALVADLWAVRAGRGINPRRATSTLASRLAIEPDGPGSPYTIDGDYYRSEGSLVVEVGPRIAIVDPRAFARRAQPRLGELRRSAGGDTMGL